MAKNKKEYSAKAWADFKTIIDGLDLWSMGKPPAHAEEKKMAAKTDPGAKTWSRGTSLTYVEERKSTKVSSEFPSFAGGNDNVILPEQKNFLLEYFAHPHATRLKILCAQYLKRVENDIDIDELTREEAGILCERVHRYVIERRGASAVFTAEASETPRTPPDLSPITLVQKAFIKEYLVHPLSGTLSFLCNKYIPSGRVVQSLDDLNETEADYICQGVKTLVFARRKEAQPDRPKPTPAPSTGSYIDIWGSKLTEVEVPEEFEDYVPDFDSSVDPSNEEVVAEFQPEFIPGKDDISADPETI